MIRIRDLYFILLYLEPPIGFEPMTHAFVRSWSRCGDLNPGPLLYESIALPLSYIGIKNGRKLSSDVKAQGCR